MNVVPYIGTWIETNDLKNELDMDAVSYLI